MSYNIDPQQVWAFVKWIWKCQNTKYWKRKENVYYCFFYCSTSWGLHLLSLLHHYLLPPSFLVSLSLQYFNSLIISTFFSLILSSLPCFASIHYWILMVNKTCSYSEVFLGINLTSCANLDIFFVLIKIWVIQCNILIHSLIHSA